VLVGSTLIVNKLKFGMVLSGPILQLVEGLFKNAKQDLLKDEPLWRFG
jgi:hypothetical protein